MHLRCIFHGNNLRMPLRKEIVGKEGDANDIVEKISKILDDKQLAIEMGKNGSKFIKEQFNWELVAKKFLRNLY